MTLTKAELTQTLVDGVGLNHREAKDMVEAFFSEISSSLESGDEVKLSNFGNFNIRDKVARPGRNPKTGEDVLVSARRVVTFHPSSALKDAAEQSTRRMRVELDESLRLADEIRGLDEEIPTIQQAGTGICGAEHVPNEHLRRSMLDETPSELQRYKIQCNQCIHYYITHDVVFRYGCRAMGFKSQRQPERDVIQASGQPCLYFQAKSPNS